MSLKMAYRMKSDRVKKYREALRDNAERLGLDPSTIDNMRQPVLVRRLTREMPQEERQALVTAMNDTFTDSKNTRMAGKSRGDRLSKRTLKALSEGLAEANTLRDYFDGKKSSEVVSLLIQDGVILPSERNQYLDAEGLLNPDGKRLVEEALRGRVAKNYETLASLPGSIVAKIDAAIPSILTAEQTSKKWNITETMSDVIDLVAEYQESGIETPEMFLRQPNMLKGNKAPSERYSRNAQKLFVKLVNDKKQDFVNAFRRYASQAQISAEKNGLPGVAQNAEDAFEKMLNYRGKEDVVKPSEATQQEKKVIPQVENTKNVDSVFGTAHVDYSGKPEQAIEHLMKVQEGYVPAAFHKEGLGDIDLPWGKGGKKGFGLAHIIERRNESGMDGKAFARSIPQLIKEGRVEKRENYPGRAYIVSDNSEASIRLEWDGKSRNWIVTAYPLKKESSEAIGGLRTSAHAYGDKQSFPLSRSEDARDNITNSSDQSNRSDVENTQNVDAVAEHFAKQLTQGKTYSSITEARKEAGEVLKENVKAGTETAKNVDEAVELGVVLAARQQIEQARKENKTDVEIFRGIVDLYRRQPTLGTRTSTSIAQQAYSTPSPIAFLASRLAGINNKTTVYEPTAGNGMLLIEANPKNTFANELNKNRAERLRSQGFHVTEQDAVEHNPAQKTDVVIANPPFGRVWNDDYTQTKSLTVGNLTTAELDQAIVAKSLENLKDKGRAVLIIGGKQGNKESRKKAYRSKGQVSFYKWLYGNYKVLDHFSID